MNIEKFLLGTDEEIRAHEDCQRLNIKLTIC